VVRTHTLPTSGDSQLTSGRTISFSIISHSSRRPLFLFNNRSRHSFPTRSTRLYRYRIENRLASSSVRRRLDCFLSSCCGHRCEVQESADTSNRWIIIHDWSYRHVYGSEQLRFNGCCEDPTVSLFLFPCECLSLVRPSARSASLIFNY